MIKKITSALTSFVDHPGSTENSPAEKSTERSRQSRLSGKLKFDWLDRSIKTGHHRNASFRQATGSDTVGARGKPGEAENASSQVPPLLDRQPASLGKTPERQCSTIPAFSNEAQTYTLKPISVESGNEHWFDGIPSIDHAAVVTARHRGEDENGVKPWEEKGQGGSVNPNFTVPRRQRLGQPFDRSKPGFTAVETNAIRPYGNLFNAFAATSHGSSETNLAITGISVGGVHEAIGAVLNGHAVAASLKKRIRYARQLEAMLEADVARFRSDAASVDAKPHLDTLLLTRDRNGRFAYDMEKVAKLAVSGDSAHADVSAHAKNIFLTAFIKDEVAGKRHDRAAYEVSRNIMSAASATLLVAGTHGLAAVPATAGALAAKEGGLALGFANALDIGKGIRGTKQRLRDSKQREINDGFLKRRNDLKVGDIPADIPDDIRPMAIAAVHGAMQDASRFAADQTRFGRGLIKGSRINEKKSTSEKIKKADIAAGHAVDVIEYHIDAYLKSNPENLQNFYRNINANGVTLREKSKILSESIKKDADLETAYVLMRDVGMRRSEATGAIYAVIQRKLEYSLATDPNTPLGAALPSTIERAKQQGDKPSDADVRTMRGILQRR